MDKLPNPGKQNANMGAENLSFPSSPFYPSSLSSACPSSKRFTSLGELGQRCGCKVKGSIKVLGLKSFCELPAALGRVGSLLVSL